MSDDEFVEKVAMAIFRAHFAPDEDEAVVTDKWNEWPETHRKCNRFARAAIRVMNEDYPELPRLTLGRIE